MTAILGKTAFGGGPLLGDKIVRMAFIDEAGVSNPKHEPWLCVAGTIVHCDRQWKPVEKYLVELGKKYCPPDHQGPFFFHAKELFSGGKTFTREKYDREARWAILDELVSVPTKFNLPVFGFGVERKAFSNIGEAYAVGYMDCAATVEAYMRCQPDRDEVASLILEDNSQVRSHVRDIHFQMQDERGFFDSHADFRDKMWLTRVIGEPHFEAKSIYSPLQIADVCAFVMKRHFMGKDIKRFTDPLLGQAISFNQVRPWRDAEQRF